MILLDLDRVCVNYRGTPALFGVSFVVNEGEIVSIVGSNGAGKSTILRTISGLLKPSSGTVKLKNERIDGKDPAKIVALHRVAHVPEGRLIFPRLTVLQNLIMGAYTTDKSKVKELVDWVFELFPKLRDRRSQLGGTLSGGEQQALAIARGLMLNPVLLMLDEPSLGVQPNIVTKIYDAIKAINERGTTIILVEQNVRIALSVAHRAYVLQTGKIITEGSGRELLDSEIVRRAYLGL